MCVLYYSVVNVRLRADSGAVKNGSARLFHLWFCKGNKDTFERILLIRRKFGKQLTKERLPVFTQISAAEIPAVSNTDTAARTRNGQDRYGA